MHIFPCQNILKYSLFRSSNPQPVTSEIFRPTTWPSNFKKQPTLGFQYASCGFGDLFSYHWALHVKKYIAYTWVPIGICVSGTLFSCPSGHIKCKKFQYKQRGVAQTFRALDNLGAMVQFVPSRPSI